MTQATNQNTFTQFIIDKRQALMGLSIIAILLYHSYVWIGPEQSNYLKIFKFGYIGVDIFMYLSGFGLCFSYVKNKVSIFYFRRLIRIFPLNILAGIFISLLGIQHGDNITVWDFVCNVTTLYYYGIGGTYWNWFIPAIVILYMLFPVFFFLSKKLGLYLFIILNFSIISILALYNIDWRYSCLISRLPIFISGVLTFFFTQKEQRTIILFLINFLFFVICSSYNLSEYYLTTTFCPLLLVVIYLLRNKIPFIPFIETLGKYSLEIFLGNSISYYVLHIFIRYNNNFFMELLVYFISTYIISSIFIYANRIISLHFHSVFK